VIGSLWGLLLVGLVLASSVMAALWYVQVRIGDASHVDVAWAALIAGAGDPCTRCSRTATLRTSRARRRARVGVGPSPRRLPLRRSDPRTGRGRPLPGARAKWGARASSRFFWFFQFQALFVVFFSLPFALVCLDPDRAISALAWAGVAVWAIGNVGTIVADRQLAVWRANPANHGKTARTGSGAGRATQLLLRVGELVRRRHRRDDRPAGWIAGWSRQASSSCSSA
jgi:steroid 5-alpha reductase family enzyme